MCHVLKNNIADFRHIRNSLTIEASKSYLNAMILSYFHYCIRSLHKQALTVVDWKPLQHHHCDIHTCIMLSFNHFILYSAIRIVNISHNAAPPMLKSFVQLGSEQMCRASRLASSGDCSFLKRGSTTIKPL